MTTSLERPAGAADWSAWADAAALRLAARAEAAETLRKVPRETLDEAAAAGFFAMLAPTTAGGQGASLAEFAHVTRRLAQGCTSSAWTLSFLALHVWLLCKFELALQDELFAGGALPMAPAPLAPTGTATPVPGGYKVTGRWEWASGVRHADWVIVHAIEPGAMGPRFCVLPISDVRVEDVWRVAGMCATGSDTVVIEDVFVPEHRTLPAMRIKLGASPGEARHPGSTVVYPMTPVLGLVAATPALGAAEGALEAFTQRMRAKTQAFSGLKQADLAATHLRLGEAMATVRAARLVWESALALITAEGPKGNDVSVGTLAALRLASADVVRLANQAVNTLANAAGASAGFLSFPLQRQLRDVQMIRGHAMYDWDRAAQVAGKIALGHPPMVSDML